jgi:phage antirepressor YoqD-like protein
MEQNLVTTELEQLKYGVVEHIMSNSLPVRNKDDPDIPSLVPIGTEQSTTVESISESNRSIYPQLLTGKDKKELNKKTVTMNSNITTTTQSIFKMAEAANECEFKSRTKLFEFLRRYGVIKNQYPSPEFIVMGYFEVNHTEIWNQGRLLKTVPQIYVTRKGIKFIKDLYKVITKNLYVPFHATN